MKRVDLVRTIGAAANDAGFEWRMLRQGSDHEVWELDGLRVIIPRHREINERTAGRILRHLEDKLGQRWWRR